MGEKDITEKALEAYNDVFADIVNVLLFQGQFIIQEHDLEDALPRSHYKSAGKIHEMERDVAKFWKKQNIRIAFYGLENQTTPDPYMPLRMIRYDGTAYRAQLLNLSENDNPKHIYPVVTLVLYFGLTHWNKPLSLLNAIDIPHPLKPFVNDYKVNLFEIAYLTDQQVQMFQSDFRFVADYFVQSRKNQNYTPTPGTIRHVHETLELLKALTGDLRFEKACQLLKGDETTMGEAILDRMEALAMERGWKRGMENGFKQGIEKGIEQGVEQGENYAFSLVQFLIANDRLDDLKKAAEDPYFRQKLLTELSNEHHK